MFSSVGIAVTRLVTETFSSNTTWVAPANVSVINSMSGYGAPGTAAYTDPNSPQTLTVMTVTGSYSAGPTSGYASGTLDWASLRSQAQAYQTEINGGGTGNDTAIAYTQYTDSKYTQVGSRIDWTSAIAGTASISYVAFPSSGSVTSGANGTATVTYTQQGATHAATTGASATGFGKTFLGGTGGAATPTNFTNVTVVPNASYNLVVPSGGSITITYYK
jgi:hypothetical protein